MPRSHPHPRGSRVVVAATAALLAIAAATSLTACRSDGRELRPPRPDQTASISSAATPGEGTEFTLPEIDDADDTGDTAPMTSAPSQGGGGIGAVVAPWIDGAPIDPRNTCDGLNVSPALSWGPGPEGTVEVALSLSDLDAPDFVHWVVAGLDPTDLGVDEGSLPIGAVEATNGVGDIGYTGPCPPAGSTHRYVLTVHYLGEESGLADGATGAEMLARIRATVIGTGEVSGTFSRG